MKKIIEGPIHSLYIKNIEINDGILKIQKADITIIKNALFYINYLGHPISFDYNTVLPYKEEADDYLENYIQINSSHPEKINPENGSCLYIKPEELQAKEIISNNEFKLLKQKYKSKK